VTYSPAKLDVACGARKQSGYTGIDLAAEADIIWDLFEYPWPIADGVVHDVYCSHFVEHIPHWRPHWGGREGWWLFWEEIWRICQPGAVVQVVHPYLKHSRAFQDPTHERYIPEATWSYLDASWREAQLLGHYDTTVDFAVTQIRARGTTANDIPVEYWDQLPDLEVWLTRRG
jgi:hypothetical protein